MAKSDVGDQRQAAFFTERKAQRADVEMLNEMVSAAGSAGGETTETGSRFTPNADCDTVSASCAKIRSRAVVPVDARDEQSRNIREI